MATGHDPVVDEELEWASTLATSVKHRIALGDRTGQNVQRIGSGFSVEGEFVLLTQTLRAGALLLQVHYWQEHPTTQV